jgi:hypothetical protein
MNNLPFDDEVHEWLPKQKPKYYNLHRLACGFNNKMALISMICSLMQAYEQSKKVITFLELINKLSDETTDDLKKELAEICEAFYADPKIFDNFGFKSAKEIKIEVNRILSLELPF